MLRLGEQGVSVVFFFVWTHNSSSPSPSPIPTASPTQSIKPPAINQISPNIIRDGKSNETEDSAGSDSLTLEVSYHPSSRRLRGQRVKLWKMNAWNALLIVLMLRCASATRDGAMGPPPDHICCMYASIPSMPHPMAIASCGDRVWSLELGVWSSESVVRSPELEVTLSASLSASGSVRNVASGLRLGVNLSCCCPCDVPLISICKLIGGAAWVGQEKNEQAPRRWSVWLLFWEFPNTL